MNINQAWRHWRSLPIREQVVWARRILPLTIFVAVGGIQLWLNLSLFKEHEVFWEHLGIELLIYALLGPLVTWNVLLWIERQLSEKERVEKRFREQEQRMLQIADDVRAEIANDLHDTLGPNLYATALKAAVCRKLLHTDLGEVDQELQIIHGALKQSIREVRRAVYALRPVELERIGLFETLRKLCADFEEVNQIRMELTITGEEDRLTSELEVGLFHIIQEALHNISRHAGAKTVVIQLDIKPQLLCLRLSDDGAGYDMAATQAGVGQRHMKERADALGGNLSIRSEPDKGTEIVTCLPRLRGGQ